MRRRAFSSGTGKGVGECVEDEFVRRVVQALWMVGQVLFGCRDDQFQVHVLRKADMEPFDIMAPNEVGDAEDIRKAGGLFDMGRVLRTVLF